MGVLPCWCSEVLLLTGGKSWEDYHGKKLAKWSVFELHGKCKLQGLYQIWSCCSWKKLWIYWRIWIFWKVASW